jgi:hypothetical protein
MSAVEKRALQPLPLMQSMGGGIPLANRVKVLLQNKGGLIHSCERCFELVFRGLL